MSMIGRRFRELSPTEKVGQFAFWLIVVALMPLLVPLMLLHGLGLVSGRILDWLADDRRWFNELDRMRW